MFKKITFRIICILIAIINCLPKVSVGAISGTPTILNVPFYKRIIELFLPSKQKEEVITSSGKFVYVSGYPIGFSVDGAGAVVVEKSSVITEDGYKEPFGVEQIQIGDILKEINGVAISSGETITIQTNKPENIGKEITMKLIRKEEEKVVKVKAEYDIFANSYRLGLWVRDNAIGVGMMTYIDENGRFGSLGHPITDIDTGAILPISGGSVYKCSIIGVKKGEKGNPGELKGLFLKSSSTVGEVEKNLNSGVYGKINENNLVNFQGEKMEIALPSEVEMGPATILSTIDGIAPKSYNIEIVKTNYTNANGEKCMIIRITDPELIKLTGGIVQGMSGSPIIQKGKLIGCVTHVFISDPEKGFASFITTMIEN